MSSQAKLLLNPSALSALSGEPICCQIVEALAGDCRSGFADRLRQVEAGCSFGTRCTRGCHEVQPTGYGFAGKAAVLAGIVGPIEPASNDRSLKEEA